MWKIFKAARAAVAIALFYGGGLLSGVLVLPVLWAFERDPERRVRATQRYVSGAFRWMLSVMRAFRLFDFDPDKVAAGLADEPVLVVANHPCTIDVVAVLSVYRDASVVVKHKIWRNPFLRPLFVWCGHIDGGDGTMVSNKRVLDQMKDRLARGMNVVIFPEGTRSPPGGLGKLHKGAFSVASQTGVPVLPVLVTADPPVLHKEQPWYVWPRQVVRYRVCPGEVVRMPRASARKLVGFVDAWYRSRIETNGEAA